MDKYYVALLLLSELLLEDVDVNQLKDKVEELIDK